MNDTLKDATIALLGLWLFSGLLTERVQQAAYRDLRAAIPDGQIKVQVVPRGLYGMVVGHAYSATVSGGGFATDTLPFRVEPGGGVRAHVRHLVLDLHDIVLRDLPVQSLKADIPFVTLDGERALFSAHITLRSAEEGRGVAVLTAEGLAQFLRKKRPQWKDLEIRLIPGEFQVRARAALFTSPSLVEARGRVGVAEGRYLNAVDTRVLMNGKELSAALTERLLRSLNPIIDVERDLGLGDWLYVTDAEVGDGILTVRARVTIPRTSVER